MKILITGINGFIGRNLSTLLHTNTENEIVGVEQQGKFEFGGIKIHPWEDLNKITNSNCIIHLAGLAHDTKNKFTTEQYYQINTELTKNIFKYFLNSTATTFIFFSSVKAVADFSDTYLTETANPTPVGIYGKSKLLAEEYILSNMPHDSRNVYILRPCLIHGPKLKGNILSLFNFIDKGMPYPLGSISNSRSYLSITNLNFIIENLLGSKIESGIYNLADDEPLSTNRIVELIGETINKKPVILYPPRWILEKIGFIGTLFKLPFNEVTLKKLIGNYLVSNEKIKISLNIELPIRAEEGMRHTLINIK